MQRRDTVGSLLPPRRQTATAGGDEEESQQVAGEPLSFGDTVLFFSEKDGYEGYLYNENPLKPTLHVRAPEMHDPDLPNIKGAAFTVLPANKYKMSKKLNKYRAQVERRLAKERKKNKDATQEITVTPEESRMLSQLEAAVEAEQHDNETEQERMRHKPVTYGLVVQLLHNLTNQFVTVSTEDPASTDVTGMRVFTRTNSSKHAWFRIMPRYKVRSEGDMVRMGDQILLESVKTPGQFIFVSKRLDKAVLEDDYLAENAVLTDFPEVALSVHRDAFTVRPHVLNAAPRETSLRGGDTIVLLHKEIDAYLVAEGNYLNRGVGEGVHLRERKGNKRVEGNDELMSLDSAITFWQIDIAGHGSRGNVILWEQPVRLRHMLTRKYLAFQQTGKSDEWTPVLTTAKDTQTYFKLYPVVKEGLEIPRSSFARIEHISSGKWLHGQSSELHERQQYSIAAQKRVSTIAPGAAGTGIQDLKWDNANVYKVASFEFRYDDAFAILPVQPLRIRDLNFCLGLLPLLDQYLRMFEASSVEKDVPLNFFASVRNVVLALVAFLRESKEGANTDIYRLEKSRQKLLRQTRIIDIVVMMLKVPFKPSTTFKQIQGFNANGIDLADVNKYPRFELTCQAVYELLSEYLVGDSRKNELYVAKYIPFFQSQLGSPNFGVAQMLMELVADNDKILDRIEPAQVESFVYWLCESKDSNFLRFLDALCSCDGRAIAQSQRTVCDRLNDANKKTPVLYLFKREASETLMQSFKEKRFLPIAQFFSKEHVPSDKEIKGHINYVQRQISLMALMCLGRNKQNQDIMRTAVSYEIAFDCANNDAIPQPIRAAFVRFINYVYVDAGNNFLVLDNVKLSFAWKDLEKPFMQTDRPTVSITGCEMPEFPQLRDFVLKHIRDNQVMIAKEMQRNSFVREVLALTGKLVGYGYYTSKEDIENLLQSLINLMDGTIDLAIQDQEPSDAESWRAKERYKKSSENKAVVNAKFEGFTVLKYFVNLRTSVRLKELLHDFKKITAMRDTGGTLGRTALSSVTAIFSGPAIMQDEAMVIADAVQKDVGTSQVMQYLNNLFKRTDMLKRDRIVHILLDLAKYQYTKMTFAALNLIDQLFSEAQTIFENTCLARILVTDNSITMFDEIEQKLTDLRALLQLRQLDKSDEDRMRQILVHFTRICRIEGAVTEPHQINVMLLYQSGVIDELIELLEIPVSLDLGGTESQLGMISIKTEAFKLLGALCRKNPAIQADVFSHLDMLIHVPGNGPLQGEKGLALNEVFLNNQELCIKIKDYQINEIVKLVAEHRRWEFLHMLNTLAKIDSMDLPIRRNQNLIIKYMMQRRNETVPLVSDEENEERIQLLLDGSAGKLSSEKALDYKYHIRLVRMLATCSEGDNRFIESMCQNIFSPEEIYQVLLNEKIDMNARRPYLRFFLWAWLNSEMSVDLTKIEELQYETELWQFLPMLARFTVAFTRKNLDTILDTEPGQQEVITVFEAFMPFLESFFSKYFVRNERLERERPEWSIVLKDVIDALLLLLEVIADKPAFGTKKRLTDVKDVFLVMMDKELLSESQLSAFEKIQQALMQNAAAQRKEKKKKRGNETSRRMIVDTKASGNAPEAVVEYMKVFRQELTINEGLDTFVERLQRAYRNNHTTPRFNDVEGSEDLPLGQEFMEHVRLFVELTPHSARNHTYMYDGLSKWANVLVLGLDVAYRIRDTIEEQDKPQLDRLSVKLLNIMRAMIVMELMQKPKVIRGNEDEFQRVEANVIRIQDDLNDLKVSLTLLPLMAAENEATSRAALRLLIALLDGGNHDVQESLYDFFMGTRNESFFMDIQRSMIESAASIKEIRALMTAYKREIAARKELITKTLKKSSVRAGSLKDSGSVIGGDSSSLLGTVRRSEAPKKGEMTELQELQVQHTMTTMLAEMGDDDEDPPVDFDAVAGLCKELLRIIQLLCEGQNQKMKSYIAKQPDNIKSVNLVQKAVEYLHVIYLNIDEDSVDLVIQNLETLIEVTMGNQPNQVVVFDAKVVDIINHLLRQEQFNDCTPDHIAEIKKGAVLLASTLLEENGAEAASLASDLYVVLDLDAVRSTMYDPRYGPSKTVEGKDVDPADIGFLAYRILQRFRDFNPRKSATIEEDLGLVVDVKKEKDKAALLKELAGGMEHIEILVNDSVEKVYFRVGNMRRNLRNELKDELLWSVDRSTPVDKIRDFLERGEDFLAKMKYQDTILRIPLFKFLILDISPYLYWFILLLTLVINIVMLSVWENNSEDFDVTAPIVPDWYHNFLYVIGSVHIFTSVLIAVLYFIANPPRNLNPLDLECDVYKLSFWYYLAFVGFSFAGVFTDGYTFCFHLLHVIVNNDLLVRVLQSVTKNGRALLMVTLLGVIIMYQYALILFAYYRSSIAPDINGLLLCNTFWQCFITTLSNGLRAGGGIGDVLDANGNDSWPYIGVRALLDISYFVIITTIGLNIIFGIIVDTFSELRDEKFEIEEDMRSRCFVCSLPADEFDRTGSGFQNHIDKDHNMWAYLFFLAYLGLKDDEEYTAHEQYVWDRRNEPDWFPINRALDLQQDSNLVEDQLQEIREKLDTILERFRQEDERRLEESQRARQATLMGPA